MNKNIIKSIENLLYKKVVSKIEEMRQQMAASLFEYRFPEEQEGEEERERMEMEADDEEERNKARKDDCLHQLKKKYPNKSAKEYEKMIDDGECRKLDESNIPEPVIKRRIAGGMDPKTAKTKKLGFRGKHPGKG